MKITPVIDTKALSALQTNLSSIASGEVARDANRQLAAVYQGFVDDQFVKGRSPYGERWDAPKDGGRPGYRSGDLSRDAKVRAAGNRITLSTGLDYARHFVRSGRDIFPTAANGLPVKWKEAGARIHRAAVRAKLRGR